MRNKKFSENVKITHFSYMFDGRTNVSECARSSITRMFEHVETRATLPAPLLS